MCILFMGACTADDPASYCFAFDERQCQTDIWKDDTNPPGNVREAIIQLRQFLENQNLEVVDIIYDENFYDAVCEACHICPTGTRYFVQVEESPGLDVSNFDLLNLEAIDCDNVF